MLHSLSIIKILLSLLLIAYLSGCTTVHISSVDTGIVQEVNLRYLLNESTVPDYQVMNILQRSVEKSIDSRSDFLSGDDVESSWFSVRTEGMNNGKGAVIIEFRKKPRSGYSAYIDQTIIIPVETHRFQKALTIRLLLDGKARTTANTSFLDEEIPSGFDEQGVREVYRAIAEIRPVIQDSYIIDDSLIFATSEIHKILANMKNGPSLNFERSVGQTHVFGLKNNQFLLDDGWELSSKEDIIVIAEIRRLSELTSVVNYQLEIPVDVYPGAGSSPDLENIQHWAKKEIFDEVVGQW